MKNEINSNPVEISEIYVNFFIFSFWYLQEDRRPDLPESPLHCKYKHQIKIKFLWMVWNFIFRTYHFKDEEDLRMEKEFNWIDKLKCFFMNIYYYLEHNLGKLTKKEKT